MTGSYCVGSGTLWKNAVGVNLQIIAFCFIYLLHSILTFLGYKCAQSKKRQPTSVYRDMQFFPTLLFWL